MRSATVPFRSWSAQRGRAGGVLRGWVRGLEFNSIASPGPNPLRAAIACTIAWIGAIAKTGQRYASEPMRSESGAVWTWRISTRSRCIGNTTEALLT